MAFSKRSIATFSATCIVLLITRTADAAGLAQVAASTNGWLVAIQAAFVGALTAIVVPFIKDALTHAWTERRTRIAKQRDVFRNYAAPLTAAAERLTWRLSEVLVENRHQFLKTVTLPLVYNEYKRKSTLYRIASVLGWMRAINLELSALPRGSAGFLMPVSRAMNGVQRALADGPHVELHRLERLCEVWDVCLEKTSEADKKTLATRIEVRLYDLAGDSLKHDSEHLKNLPDEKKAALCRTLAAYLCAELGRSPLDDGLILESINSAVAAMSYREALIYRDWQDAIGDAMLQSDSDSIRRYKIIGYEAFENVLKANSLWIEVFRQSIDDIDFEKIDPNDFRAKQLKDLSRSVAEILISMSKSDQADLVSPDALVAAKELVKIDS